MRIGILGRGTVGAALADGFASRGHEVEIGGRDDFAGIAERAELVVLAVKGAVAEEVVANLGPERLAGKVLIDATNPLRFRDGGPPELFVGHDDSLGERVQRAAPEARVVKCFNIITASEMVEPSFSGGDATMFIAGDDEAAKRTVLGILDAFGWKSTFDAGGIEASRMLEPLCLLWVHVGIRRGSWNHAFALLTG